MQKPALHRLPLLLAAAFASEWIYAADTAQNAEQVQLEEVIVTGERTTAAALKPPRPTASSPRRTSTAAATTFPRPICSNRA